MSAFPAARVGDTITHDAIVPSGAVAPNPADPVSTVFIENRPAATVGCSTPCTGVTGLGPAHPPPFIGAITTGSLTVTVSTLPAARWGPAPDLTVCGAFVGDPKLYATRTVIIG